MKRFACGDVVVGCQATWTCATEEELFGQIARHAEAEHGLSAIPPELLEQVRAKVMTLA